MKQSVNASPVGHVEERLRALLVRSLDGDEPAYHAFLDHLRTHLRAFLRRRLTYLQDDVEDVVQEILLAVHTGRHTYRSHEPLTAWVHAIARYKLADFLRTRSRREALHDPLDDELELVAVSEVESSDARRDLARLLNHLPERQRLMIVQVKLLGLSIAETARHTGLSQSAIKVGIHRGLKALALRA